MLKDSSYILFYHRITPENMDIFKWQLKWIKKNKKVAAIEEMENLKPNSVIITFDDGFFDNFVYAFPILKEFQIPATIFLSTAYISETGVRKNLEDYWNGDIQLHELQQPENYDFKKFKDNKEFLSWEEIEIMYKTGLISFQSHGHQHLKHYFTENLDQCSHFKSNQYLKEEKRFETDTERENRLNFQFTKSRESIKKFLGYYPEHFCWPWGEYDEFSIKAGKKAGYRYFYTTEKGVINKDFNLFDKIPRISASFKKKTFLKRNYIFSSRMLTNVYLKFFG